MKLGCIGDDFTGSSDLANTLTKEGMRTVQYTGVPEIPAAPDVEAGVVSLKSRTIPVADAVAQSLAALDWLRAQGCTQFFFKYCSTFDSTKEGNIGPVAAALAETLGADCVIVCPAFPGTGRSLYQGNLFVGDRPLNESGMQNHPLTPMTDADIRRWLGHQTDLGVGHVPFQTVAAGPAAIAARLLAEADGGRPLIVTDAIRDEDLRAIGTAARDLALITGGSGIALGLPANFRDRGEIAGTPPAWAGEAGPVAALSGSCSEATRTQIRHHAAAGHPTYALDAAAVIDGALSAAEVADWVLARSRDIPLVYSSADPAEVAAIQSRFGTDRAAHAIESFFAGLARALVTGGVTRLLPAGGETSGAVVSGLDLTALDIGPEIDPGVPALRGGPKLVLALKSGNFGATDYFEKAAARLAEGAA